MTVLFAGSFHPPTVGHEDIIRRSARMFDKVYVAVMVNAQKTYRISLAERMNMLRRIVGDLKNVEIVSSDGLTAQFAKELGAEALVRGVRGTADLEYEMQIADVNRMLTGLDTVFLPAIPAHRCVSSSMVCDVAAHNGSIEGMVSPVILEDIRRIFERRS